jgi:hypothetical protein
MRDTVVDRKVHPAWIVWRRPRSSYFSARLNRKPILRPIHGGGDTQDHGSVICEEIAQPKDRNEPIRVVFVGVPTLMASLIERDVARRSGIELLAPKSAVDRQIDVDVVVLGSEGLQDPVEVRAALGRWPSAQVIEVHVSRGGVALYELRPCRRRLGELDASEIVDLIARSTTSSWAGWRAEA